AGIRPGARTTGSCPVVATGRARARRRGDHAPWHLRRLVDWDPDPRGRGGLHSVPPRPAVPAARAADSVRRLRGLAADPPPRLVPGGPARLLDEAARGRP